MGTWLEHVVVALGWQHKGMEYKETSFTWGKNISWRAPVAATRRRCWRCRRLAGGLFQEASLAAELLGWGALLEDRNLASFTCILGLPSAHCQLQLRKSWGVAKVSKALCGSRFHNAPTPAACGC